jgi:hypothetical protein
LRSSGTAKAHAQVPRALAGGNRGDQLVVGAHGGKQKEQSPGGANLPGLWVRKARCLPHGCEKADYAMKVKRSHGNAARRSCAQAVRAVNVWNMLVMGLLALERIGKTKTRF